MPTDPTTTTALLLSGPAVCARLGIGVSSLHALRRAGKFPLKRIRLGRSVRFSAAELAEWVADGCPARARWQGINEKTAGANRRQIGLAQ
jgi:predicted DNA-binding transcriptional regulator AlpA